MTEDTKPKFKVKAHVTLRLLKVVEGVDYAVTIETPFIKGEAAPARKVKVESTDPATGEVAVKEEMSKPQEPPVLCQVTNLYDGERMQMIAGSVFHSEIVKKYTADSYVGKSFAFKVYAIQGKRYKGVELTEVEVETPADDKTADAVADTAPAGKSKK